MRRATEPAGSTNKKKSLDFGLFSRLETDWLAGLAGAG